MKWYQDKVLWIIIIAAALLKLVALAQVYFLNPLGEQALIFPDSLGYIYPAQTLLTYGQLWEAVSAAPLLMRTPGYPVFLALAQWLTHSATWGIVVVQNILSLVLLLPVYLTTLRLADRTAARWAAGFCAASVLYFSLSFAILTETVCVFLLAWFVFFAVRWLQIPRARDLFAAAVFLTLAVYVRPVAYYFVAVSFVLLGALAAYQKSRVLAKQMALCFVLPLVVGIGTWQVRNHIKTGYNGFTSVRTYNLYIWNADYVAQRNHISVSQAHKMLLAFLPPDFNSWPAAAQIREYKRLAAPLLQKGKWYKLVHLPVWAGKTLFGTNYTHVSRLAFGYDNKAENALSHSRLLPRTWLYTLADITLFILALLQVGLVVSFGCFGFYYLWKSQPVSAVFLAVYTGYFWMIGSCFFGAYARFRAPFEFVLCITAGLTAATLLARWKKS